jgi:hypothetical protein
MPDNWSVDEQNIWKSRELTPSAGVVTHPDPRMALGIKDMPKYPGVLKPLATPNPRGQL